MEPLAKSFLSSLPSEDTDSMDTETEVSQSDTLELIRNFPRAPLYHRVLPMKSRQTPKLTVVLDLDETLIHTELTAVPAANQISTLRYNETTCVFYVLHRPWLLEFLSAASSLFELVLFTASEKAYAEQILNFIDKDRKYLKHRLYRDSCVEVQGNYVKDLAILGRDLSQVVIVDNSLIAFAMNLENGIHIRSWYDDPNDRELFTVFELLNRLQYAEDVRPALRNYFKLR